ncbi:hypothetical protein L3X38_024815 [Prunus dulcis]|uniref:Metallo-beta-lactamase domain-containing protein n=1 Tax=Prunus dulcis TaxID=3755 RepID=A0AAD4W386_PRUDU|nr:hypothetical protein L3X38_024815 [Prunus dulcis]
MHYMFPSTPYELRLYCFCDQRLKNERRINLTGGGVSLSQQPNTKKSSDVGEPDSSAARDSERKRLRLISDHRLWPAKQSHRFKVQATPGHTLGCVTYVTGDGPNQPQPRMAFTGDALLIRGWQFTSTVQVSSFIDFHIAKEYVDLSCS